MIRACALFVLGTAALGAGCSPAAIAQTARCATVVPAEIRGGPSNWLGECANGKAAGVGVLRVGARAPFSFFFGRMIAGMPRTGLVMLGSGNIMPTRGLSATGTVLPIGGDNAQEQDRAWADAAAGARLAARRYAAAGNKGSASYYTGWARKIETQRQE